MPALESADPAALYEVNRTLVKTEAAFLLPAGLPGRPWYRHALYAPGLNSGYESVALPGVEESINAGNFEEAQRQLEALTAALRRATAVLQGTQ